MTSPASDFDLPPPISVSLDLVDHEYICNLTLGSKSVKPAKVAGGLTGHGISKIPPRASSWT